jgi:hypothetical protein
VKKARMLAAGFKLRKNENQKPKVLFKDIAADWYNCQKNFLQRERFAA